MVLTYSTMLPLETKAPSFTLPDVRTGKQVSLDDYVGKDAVLVMFICAHCPYVVHVKHELAKLGRDYANTKLGIIAISSNDADNYPDDSPANLKTMGEELDLAYPLLYDEDQSVAKKYSAACTPDFFLFNKERQLVYRGQLDDSRRGNDEPVNGKDLRAAIEQVLAGKPVPKEQKPSTGCNIKWKPGNSPND
jgi:peroxiredoxin